MRIKRYNVYFIEQAENDLYEIFSYVAIRDSGTAAEKLFQKLAEQCMKLEYMPERGGYPKELTRVGIVEFRELNVKPFRIIYQLLDKDVYIHAILDGRRDLEEHLMGRLLAEIEK